MRTTPKILFLFLFLVLGIPSLSHALSGGLDADFADDGIAVIPIVGTDRGLSVALDSGGRIVAGGYSQGVTHNHLAAVRLLPDGFLDNSFAGDGRLDLNFVGHDSSEGQAIAVQPDGKILGAGSQVMDGSTGATDFAIARLNEDGSLDASFNGTGVVTTDMGGLNDIIVDMALDGSGRIVAAGQSGGDFALARYDADGTLDPGFGSGGKVVTSIGSSSDFAKALTLQADGKILVAGRTTQVGGTDAVVVRYNTDGSLDTGFGSGGKAITNLGFSADFGEDVAVQGDGKIVLTGFVFDGTKDNIALARYLPNGTLDPDFGTGGLVITDTGFRSEAYGVAIQPDGRIVVAGIASSGAEGNVGLARYLPDGTLDANFGASGITVMDVDPGATDAAYELVLQPDGKIVAVGSSHQLFAVFRFMGKNTADLKIAGGTASPTAGAGEPVAFTFTVTNIGPDPATDVVVTGSLSGNLGLDAASLAASQGSCEPGEPLVCRLGLLANGAVAIVNYTALAAAEGSASSDLAVTQYDDDPDTSDNNAVVTIDVVAAHASGAGDGSGASADDAGGDGGSVDGGGDSGGSGSSGGCSLIR